MDAKRVWPAFWLGLSAYTLGLAVWCVWPQLQQFAVDTLPPETKFVAGQIAYWGIFLTLGFMVLGVLPPYHRLRIIGDGIGLCAFLVNLLFEKNSGNVALEVALLVTAVYSLIANAQHHQPVTATWGAWLRAVFVLAVCYTCGIAVAMIWPVTSETQWPGWYWPYVALAGALFLFASITLLEARVVRGDSWQYCLIYGVGCIVLSVSYLGEYNFPGLVLNTALAVLTYGRIAYASVQRYVEKKQAEPQTANVS